MYPVFTLIIAGAVNTVFFVLFLLSVGILAHNRWVASFDLHTDTAKENCKPLKKTEAVLYILSMAGLPLAIFISQWANQRWGWPYYDAASRFLLSIPIFFALRRLAPERILYVWFGFVLGAFVTAWTAHFAPHNWGGDQGIARIGTSFVNPIHFGDLALTLGVLPLFGLGWHTQTRRTFGQIWDYLAILGAMAGVYSSILSGSRGGWAAVPVFLILAYFFNWKQFSIRSVFLAIVGLVLFSTLFYWKIPEVHQRLDLIFSNINTFYQGHENTSIGIRFQLWKAAWLIFSDHPFFGVGMGGFKALMTPLQQMGQLTPLAADFGRQEVHSEILSRLSQLGLIGFAAIIAVYAVPGWFFWRRVGASRPAPRAAARMGVALVSGFFVFGLTVETFDLTMTAAFYALTMAVLLAATYPAN